MREMEDVFFSFTMGGEALSLAAGKATIEKLRREPVIETLRRQGGKIAEGTKALIARHHFDAVASVSGDPTWTFLLLKDAPAATAFELKTLLMQELHVRGILSLGTHNMSYAHTDADVAKLLGAYDEVFPMLADAAHNGALKQLLKCDPLVPLFKVR